MSLEEISFVFDHGIKGAREAATAEANQAAEQIGGDKGMEGMGHETNASKRDVYHVEENA